MFEEAAFDRGEGGQPVLTDLGQGAVQAGVALFGFALPALALLGFLLRAAALEEPGLFRRRLVRLLFRES